jgi:hypothetical protein
VLHRRVYTSLPYNILLIPCSRVFLEKLTGAQLLKKFPAFYGTRRMDLQEVGCGDMDWIDLAQNIDRWWALVFVVMNLRVPLTCGEYVDWLRTGQLLKKDAAPWSEQALRLGFPSSLFPSAVCTKTLYAPLLPPYVVR